MSACRTIKCHLARLNKQISENNKDFDSLSVEDKKVKIAWDVLQQLDSAKLIPVKGIYFSSKSNNTHIDSENYREELKTVEFCHVCALGGLFASYALNSEKPIKGIDSRSHYLDVGSLDITVNLSGIFSKDELDLIEWCFESWADIDQAINTKVKNWIDCTIKLNTDKKMRLIMENIVVNKGFRPDILPVCINNEWKTEKFPYLKVKPKT